MEQRQWHRCKDAVDADGEIPEGVPVEERPKEEEAKKVYVDVRLRPPREVYISRKDAEKYGYSQNCRGGSSWFRGLYREEHTPE